VRLPENGRIKLCATSFRASATRRSVSLLGLKERRTNCRLAEPG